MTGAELTTSIGGPITVPIDIAGAKVAQLVEPGAEFQFTFDLGDNWTHRCVVAEEKVDPLEVLGIRPTAPLPYWGWGSIPDQYGRRWADDDGEAATPKRPSRPHSMMMYAWPALEQLPALDPRELRSALATGDASRFLVAITGHDIDDALQQVGSGMPLALAQVRAQVEPVALSVVNRLTFRDGPGDRILAEDLLMRLRTGEVHSDNETDPMMVGEDAAIDVEEEPDRWLYLAGIGSHEGWRDMAAFAERQHDRSLRERLEQAIEGRGAFRRFRDLAHAEGIAEQWELFSSDRQLGRAREVLAAEGIRAGSRPGELA